MITLRNYEDSDVDTLVSLANNKRVSQYLVYTFPFPYTKKDAEFWITTGSKENDAITKVIVFEGRFVGSVGITPQNGWRDHCAEIGYWIGQDNWGKGIATQALNLMTSEAFQVHNFQKLFAPVLGPNVASMRVLEKCGYKLEGVLRKDVVKDNLYYDVHHFAKHRL